MLCKYLQNIAYAVVYNKSEITVVSCHYTDNKAQLKQLVKDGTSKCQTKTTNSPVRKTIEQQ